LPLLTEPCSFDLLVYTNKKAVVPKKWEDSDPRYIMNSQEVKLRSFTTSVRQCLTKNGDFGTSMPDKERMLETHRKPNTLLALAQQWRV
jgi:hypothetical protein